MVDDYRNTPYCPEYFQISERKKKLVEKIRQQHPYVKDMHAIIHPNKSNYKDDFMEIYNHKCAYCGVSCEIVGRTDFEVDHFIYENQKDLHQKRMRVISKIWY